MKIGIIGSGNVGGTLGKRWALSGHTVTFGSREPNSDRMKQLVVAGGNSARATTVAEAVSDAGVILLATPWQATQEAIAGAGDLTGKILVDATNPLKPDLSGLEVANSSSGGEMVAGWATGAKVVKAFNTVGAQVMQTPPEGALLFYCGDDAPAKRVLHGLATGLGFDARDAGPLMQARLLEPFALLWISLAYRQQWGLNFAFQVLNRGPEIPALVN